MFASGRYSVMSVVCCRTASFGDVHVRRQRFSDNNHCRYLLTLVISVG